MFFLLSRVCCSAVIAFAILLVACLATEHFACRPAESLRGWACGWFWRLRRVVECGRRGPLGAEEV